MMLCYLKFEMILIVSIFSILHYKYITVHGRYSVLKFGGLLARRDQYGGVKTTVYNIGADVCHTNLAAFVKY